jgi:putative ABC transport system permease protein
VRLLAYYTALSTGVDGMRVNALRTALSTLGVLIGVFSLVGVLVLGDGMERLLRDSIGKQALQVVRVEPRTYTRVNGKVVAVRDVLHFGVRDAAEVRALSGVADASLWMMGSATYASGSNREEQVPTIATLANGVEFERLDLVHGRFFVETEAERDVRVVVVSSELAERLAEPGEPASALGKWVRVGPQRRRVIGIFADKSPGRPLAYVPVRAARDVFSRNAGDAPAVMLVRARTIEGVEPVRSAVEDWAALRYGRPDERLEFSTYSEAVAEITQGLFVFSLVMGTITGISLLVGGIGVMNVLLASVAERTREIGLRRALGARQTEILAQFLFESLAITGVGSVLGLLLGTAAGLAVSPVIRSLTEMPFTAIPKVETILVAITVPALVGLVFGIYPARRASKLSPIDALRHE